MDRILITALLTTSCSLAAFAGPTDRQQLEFFESKVRPLLAEHCFECHSASAKRLEAGLRLDSLSGMMRGGDSGQVIEPGDPNESLLMSAVRYEDFEMPPKGKLPKSKVDTLAKWISMGAPWPNEPEPETGKQSAEFNWRERKGEHWCWQPIQPTSPPAVIDADWPKNPIDHFILAKLEAADLTPAAEADRRTLVRRLYFDMIGLPPTPQQVADFVDDDSNRGYENLVDDLLKSPHFGEKWTRHWLDLVRYGETLGHEFDYPLHHAYRYRDYVIRAFNGDVPYDQFVREHIAGDLLADPRLHPIDEYNESIIGTGFWYLGEACHSPTDVRQDEADRIDNQIDVFSKTFLGVTLACARCHDHKFDPIPTKDYYALSGYIQSSRRQEAMLDPHGHIKEAREKLESLNGRLASAWKEAIPTVEIPDARIRKAIESELNLKDEANRKALARATHPLHAAFSLREAEDFSKSAGQLAAELESLAQESRDSLAATELFIDFSKADLDGWYITGEAFANQPTRAGDQQLLEQAPFSRVGAAHSGRFGKRLHGVLRSPTFVLNHKRVHYKLTGKDARVRLIVDGYTMDEFNSLLFVDAEKKNVDTDGQSLWISQVQDIYHYVGHRAHIEIIDHGAGFAALEQIRFSDEENPVDAPHELNLRVMVTRPQTQEALFGSYVAEIQQCVTAFKAGDARNWQIDVVNWLVSRDAIEQPEDAKRLSKEVAERNAAIPKPLPVIALADGDAEDEYVFIRGNHKLVGEEAPRRLLVAIAGEDQPTDPRHSGRLELAHRLTDPSNPLTSRVIVNRLWHHLFGRGIVPTVDDFGKMGQPPTHPELLDWLADDFMKTQAWSIKGAVKQIVTSRTYRMSARPTASEEVTKLADPENKLLHRAPVRRLSGEAIRDSLLMLSGRLDRKMYGPSVQLHLTSFMEGRGRPKTSGPRDGDGRRSLYIEVRRNFLSPMMLTFDRPSPFSAMGRRAVSNVPAQSLMLLNDPFVVAQAKGWAKRLMETTDNPMKRIELAYEMAFAKKPTSAQLRSSQNFVMQASTQESVWTDLCHVLINMKPFIYLH